MRQRIGEGGADLLGQMRVDLRRPGAAVPEDLLNDPQGHPGFQQMGRERMAQRVNRRARVDAGGLPRPGERTLQAAAGDGARGDGRPRAPAARRRREKEPDGRPVGPPVRAQQGQRRRRERDVAVLVPLAMNVDRRS